MARDLYLWYLAESVGGGMGFVFLHAYSSAGSDPVTRIQDDPHVGHTPRWEVLMRAPDDGGNPVVISAMLRYPVACVNHYFSRDDATRLRELARKDASRIRTEASQASSIGISQTPVG